MNPKEKSVLLILEKTVGQELVRYATNSEVWAIDSEQNRAAGDAYIHDELAISGAGGLTIFQFDEADYAEEVIAVLENIEEHHGQHATGTPLEKVLVHHLRREPDIEQRLNADGFLVAHIDPEWTELRWG